MQGAYETDNAYLTRSYYNIFWHIKQETQPVFGISGTFQTRLNGGEAGWKFRFSGWFFRFSGLKPAPKKSQRIGAMLKEIPKASGGDRRSEDFKNSPQEKFEIQQEIPKAETKNDSVVEFEKPKSEIIRDAGLKKRHVPPV